MKHLLIAMLSFSFNAIADGCPNFRGEYYRECPAQSSPGTQQLVIHQVDCVAIGLQWRHLMTNAQGVNGWAGVVAWELLGPSEMIMSEGPTSVVTKRAFFDGDTFFTKEISTSKVDGSSRISNRRSLDLDPDGNLLMSGNFMFNAKNCGNR